MQSNEHPVQKSSAFIFIDEIWLKTPNTETHVYHSMYKIDISMFSYRQAWSGLQIILKMQCILGLILKEAFIIHKYFIWIK
jgi:hypothetical protein